MKELNTEPVSDGFDVGNAVRKLDDLEQVVEEVVEIEVNYSNARERISQFDLLTAESGLTIQTVRNCFKILKDMAENDQ